MQSLNILQEEHDNILRLTKVLRLISMDIFHQGEPPTEDIRQIIYFIREYADGEHHAKEETILFKAMLEHIPDDMAHALINHGMLQEHDQARFTIMTLETANNRYTITPTEELRLDILVALMTYADLLERHAIKEQQVAFPFGMRKLPIEIQKKIDHEMKAHLLEHEERQKELLDVLINLETKWLDKKRA